MNKAELIINNGELEELIREKHDLKFVKLMPELSQKYGSHVINKVTEELFKLLEKKSYCLSYSPDSKLVAFKFDKFKFLDYYTLLQVFITFDAFKDEGKEDKLNIYLLGNDDTGYKLVLSKQELGDSIKLDEYKIMFGEDKDIEGNNQLLIALELEVGKKKYIVDTSKGYNMLLIMDRFVNIEASEKFFTGIQGILYTVPVEDVNNLKEFLGK